MWFTWEGPGLVSGHGPEVAEVALVSNQHDDDVVVSVVPQLLQPALNVLIRQVFGDVVNQKSPHCSPVIPGDSIKPDEYINSVGFPQSKHLFTHNKQTNSRWGDGSVAFLSSCVPDLSLYRLAVHLDAAGGKLHPDGALALQVELISCEPGQQVTLPHSRVSN